MKEMQSRKSDYRVKGERREGEDTAWTKAYTNAGVGDQGLLIFLGGEILHHSPVHYYIVLHTLLPVPLAPKV